MSGRCISHGSSRTSSIALAITLTIVIATALILSGVQYHFTDVTQQQCDKKVEQRWMNYTMIGLSAAIFIIAVVCCATAPKSDMAVKVASQSTAKNSMLIVAWIMALVGTVLACVHQTETQDLYDNCKSVQKVDPSSLSTMKNVSYALMALFAISTLILTPYIYLQAMCCKDWVAPSRPHIEISGAPLRTRK